MTRPIVGYLAEFTPVPRPDDVVRDDPSPAGDPAAESASVASQMAEARQQGFDEGRELAQAAEQLRDRQVAGKAVLLDDAA